MTAVVQVMDRAAAERITSRIRFMIETVEGNLETLQRRIQEARNGQAHVALGFQSWPAYIASLFAGQPVKVIPEVRRNLVALLSAEGMSARAIAAVVGASREQIRRDLVSPQVTQNVSPAEPEPTSVVITEESLAEAEDLAGELGVQWADDPGVVDAEPEPEPKPITGLDGKTYKRPVVQPTPRAEVPEDRRPQRKPLPDEFWRATFDLGKKVKTLTNFAADDRFKRNADQIRQRSLSDLIRARDALQRVIDQLSA